MLYSGLLASCGLITSDGSLTDTGERLATLFDDYMTSSLPARAWKCKELPCLSYKYIGVKERKILRKVLLENTANAQTRMKTLKEIGVRNLRQVQRKELEGIGSLFQKYLGPDTDSSNTSADWMRRAALLELQAIPLTNFFLSLYKSEGALKGHIPSTGTLTLFQIRAENKKSLLHDVGAHLRKAKKLWVNTPPLQFEGLKKEVLNRHHIAKADNPWVDEEWRVLRRGLAPEQTRIYSYRLIAFASLLSDIGEI